MRRPVDPEERLVACIEEGGPVDADIEADAQAQRAVAKLLSRMPPEEPAPGFTQRVMRGLADDEVAWLTRLVAFFTVRRELTLRLSLVHLLYVALVPLALGAYALWPRGASAPDAARVTFVFVAPQAHSVAVAGDFNGWAAGTHVLHDPDGDGVWAGTVELAPGRYEYMFVVDGKEWVTDPLAASYRPDGFGNRNAVLEL